MKGNKKVLIFIPQGFEDIEVAAFTDILGWTRVLKEVSPVDVVLSARNETVRSHHGLTVKADVLLDDILIDDYSALIVPGGFNDSGWTEVYREDILDLIKGVHDRGGIIVAMCVAALPVAKSGILEGRKATTYVKSRRNDNLQVLRDCGAVARNERIVVSERIITNRGPDTSIDVAFKLLEMLNGRDDMEKVKKALMFQ